MIKHNRAINYDGDKLQCDCGQVCADLQEWNTHTAEMFNTSMRHGSVHSRVTVIFPNESAVLLFSPCAREGCLHEGKCWKGFTDQDVSLYGFESAEAIEKFLIKGGIVSDVYRHWFC